MELFCNLLFAHILGDFYLQWDNQCRNKSELGFSGYGLWYHSIVIGLTAWISIWTLDAWWLVVVLSILHTFIDWGKSYIAKRMNVKTEGLLLFVVDQLLHLGSLFVLSTLYLQQYSEWEQISWINDLMTTHPLRIATAMALFLSLKPANILILRILDACKVKNTIDDQENEQGNFHSGELIGWLERGLMLLFVVMDQYEAIGFLIAGKSILRFGEASQGREKSEYVLSGTLLSLSVALVLGLLVKTIV